MSEFVQYLLELLAPLQGVRARKMFGGYGLYRNEVMFGLVADNMLYLKVDQETLPQFEARELSPFQFEKNGKLVKMSYYQAPEEILESSHDLCEWVEEAHSAALRAQRGKPKMKKRGRDGER